MKKIFNYFIVTFSLVTFLASPIAAKEESILEQISKAYSKIGKKATPAVVFIETEIIANYDEGSAHNFHHFHDEFFKHFFGQPHGQGHPNNQHQIAHGSGFIIDSDGYIVTNNHVIKDAAKITCILSDGDEYAAKVIGSDPKTDLAVLKVEGKDLPTLAWGNSDEMEIGESVIAIGSPLSFQSSLTVGVISAKGRQNLRINDLEDFIQTDAAINPGNSGGPLLNINGDVIGINTAIATKSGGFMGISFAIPSNMAEHVLTQLIDQGSVSRGYLGIIMQEVDKEIAEALNLDQVQGVLVSDVLKDSPAEKAGIKQGDIILSYNDKIVKNINSFRNDIAFLAPQDLVNLKIMRNGKELEALVTLEKSPQATPVATPSIHIGMEVNNLKDIPANILQKYGFTHETEGIIITSIKPGSIAERAGLKPGMLIQQINQVKVSDKEEFMQELKASESKKAILLLIRHKNSSRFINIKIK